MVSDEYTLKGNQVAGANIPVNTGTAVGENGNYYVVVTIDGETVTSPTYRITK